MEGLRILSLDGGGVRCLSTLIILGSIMRNVVHNNPEKGSLDGVRPCEYFDFITGAGMGGIIAFLLGRLRLTISECLVEYRNLSSLILRDGSPVPPLFDNKKLAEVAHRIVQKYSPTQQTLCDSNVDRGAKTFAYAVQTNGQRYCFRTYRADKHDLSLEDMDPNGILLRDTFSAIVAAKGLFEDEILKGPLHSMSFSDQPYPIGFSNPIIPALEEISQQSKNAPIDIIVSIGSGKVAKKDIADLLLSARIHQSGTQNLLDWWLSIPKALRLVDAVGLMLWLGRAVAGRQVQDTLDQLEKDENFIKAELVRMNCLEKYHRFEIDPVEGLGPSDFRNVKKVADITNHYMRKNTEKVQDCAKQIKKKRRPIPDKDENDWTRRFLVKGADPDLKDEDGRPPLSRSAEIGDEATVMLLLEKGANPDFKEQDGRTPLWWAAERGYKAIVELLLDKGANLESEDKHGQTPLSRAAENGYDAVVKLLLNKGANLESKDKYGQTPLWWAAENGHEAVVKLLLDKGANLESKDKYGKTLLWWAAENGREAVVKLLLDMGANLESKDKYGQTPLSRAAENGRESVVKLLLDMGANLESKDKYGQTPLSRAAENGRESVVKLLLDMGANLESKDKYGQTPLSRAAENGREAVVKLLLDKGADVDAKDTSGQTPLLWAAQNGHIVVVKLLQA